MRTLEGRDLLDLSDTTRGLGSAHRSILLLARCDPDLTVEAASRLDVGAFDARLLDLCQAYLGATLSARARCPACAAALDVEIEIESLRQPQSAGADAVLRAECDGRTVSFRLPRIMDLLAIERNDDPATARAALLSGCVVGIEGASGLSDSAMEAMATAMSEAAPQSDVVMAVGCDACGHRWEALVDVGAFLWRDLDYRAERLSQDVHVLASAYHWSEDAILALPPARRRRYLALVEQ